MDKAVVFVIEESNVARKGDMFLTFSGRLLFAILIICAIGISQANVTEKEHGVRETADS